MPNKLEGRKNFDKILENRFDVAQLSARWFEMKSRLARMWTRDPVRLRGSFARSLREISRSTEARLSRFSSRKRTYCAIGAPSRTRLGMRVNVRSMGAARNVDRSEGTGRDVGRSRTREEERRAVPAGREKEKSGTRYPRNEIPLTTR